MPMLVIRNIAKHFPARAPEWVTSVGLASWGMSLLGPEPVFSASVYMAGMADIMSEMKWGWLAVAVGFIRLVALFVNGTYDGFRHSPFLRASTGFVACFVWTSVWIGLLASPTGRIAYAMILAIEIINVWRAISDMGEARTQHERA
ncbi:hypothetical protein [Terrihabitans rhizophilus]|uniref:Uncharacterized protein n=1 Tax=Terrihabitans rhizophilus TaxID=3092662 RepID=A0ABU4RNW2_9HYPH|nr:hypothetical protein [Terrihabitans sp. PJ23]MDX6806291.1 hypothetical protein [Terrihabitans sp. PJ23]